ncbi:MAG: RNA-binding protein [Proteobacteria bacterium]|nr:RNA-binding protein [Pseudomonadota bacterium]
MTLSPQQNERAFVLAGGALPPAAAAHDVAATVSAAAPSPHEHDALPDDPDDAASDGDAADEERGPLRRCIVTRARRAPETMIRFVVGPDRLLVPDLTASLPGRGMWLSAERDVLETALARKAFARAARAEVLVPADLPAVIEAALTRRVIELLGLTRRAGHAVSGFAKAREWLVADRAVLIVQATDGSADERTRLLNGRAVPVIAPLPAQMLGRIFGRDHAVHVAVSAGRLATMLRTENERLAGICRTRTEADQPGG